MDTAVINIRVDRNTKSEAQKLAQELGVSLSSVIHAFLKQLIRTRTIIFTASEEPSEYLIKTLKESQEDIKAGRVSPAFSNTADAIKWLKGKNKKYTDKVR